MISDGSITVGLPCHNEEKNIVEVVKDLENVLTQNFYLWEIIIIDNCSTDQSYDLCQKYINGSKKKQLIKLKKNKENILYSGSANRIIKEALYNYVCIMDSDNQYYVEDIPKLYKKMINSESDLIFGIRKNRADNLIRSFVSKVFFFITKIIIKNNITDLNTGIKIIKKNKKIDEYVKIKENFLNPELFYKYKKLNLVINQEFIGHKKRIFGESLHSNEKILNSSFKMIRYLIKVKRTNVK